jgi:hypothetical protein
LPGSPDPVFQKRPPSLAFHARQCLGFTENGAIVKKHPVSGSPVGKNSSLIRGRRRMARIVQANRRTTNRQITVQYNSGVQNNISEHTTRQSFSRMGYCSSQLHWVPPLSASDGKRTQLSYLGKSKDTLIENDSSKSESHPGKYYLNKSLKVFGFKYS